MRIQFPLDCDDVCRFAESHLIRLTPSQLLALRDLCEGREIVMARGMGRSLIARIIGDYVYYKLQANDYTVPADSTYTYLDGVKDGLLDEKQISRFKSYMHPDVFAKEYECIY